MSRTIKRRDFLKNAGSAATLAALGGGSLLLKGCAAGKEYDLVVSGGLVYDGLGSAPIRADIGISGARIKAVGKIPGVSGGAILGDGQVGLILDTGEVAAQARQSSCSYVVAGQYGRSAA